MLYYLFYFTLLFICNTILIDCEIEITTYKVNKKFLYLCANIESNYYIIYLILYIHNQYTTKIYTKNIHNNT